MTVSIVIPAFRRPETLARCLGALVPQCIDGCEVVVVDDSRDSHEQLQIRDVCGRFPVVTYMLNNHSYGPAGARNAGIMSTSGDWVAFLDDDVIPHDDWLGRMVDAANGAETTTAGIEGMTLASGSGVWDTMVANTRGGLYLTSCIAYRRTDLTEAGLFDEAFAGPFCEDQDLAVRILAQGAIRFVPQIKVTHQPRKINLVRYVLDSFSRQRMLLYSELHFFVSQRARYHLLRHADTFWGTWTKLASRNIAALKTPGPKALVSHPIQAFVFATALIGEQLATLLLAPSLILRYFRETSDHHFPIDLEATARLCNIDLPHSVTNRLCASAKPLRALFFAVHHKPVYNATPVLRRLRPLTHAPRSQILVRVDDLFMDVGDESAVVVEALRRAGVPFCGAVRGADLCSSRAGSLVALLGDCGGEVALHGFTHAGTHGPYQSEILQMRSYELEHEIDKALNSAGQYDCNPKIFIPPFNALTAESLAVLETRFCVICGGPESVRFVGGYVLPVVTRQGARFVPSLFPFYGRAAEMRTLCPAALPPVPICMTFHVQNECRDKAAALYELLAPLAEIIVPWSTLFFDLKRSRP